MRLPEGRIWARTRIFFVSSGSPSKKWSWRTTGCLAGSYHLERTAVNYTFRP